MQANKVGEVRGLRSQIAQKDVCALPFQREITTDWFQAEIASLSAKLSSAKATVVRATASDNSNKKKCQFLCNRVREESADEVVVSPLKKTPANASALQPNAKRYVVRISAAAS